jgi:hypothetical protein
MFGVVGAALGELLHARSPTRNRGADEQSLTRNRGADEQSLRFQFVQRLQYQSSAPLRSEPAAVDAGAYSKCVNVFGVQRLNNARRAVRLQHTTRHMPPLRRVPTVAAQLVAASSLTRRYRRPLHRLWLEDPADLSQIQAVVPSHDLSLAHRRTKFGQIPLERIVFAQELLLSRSMLLNPLQLGHSCRSGSCGYPEVAGSNQILSPLLRDVVDLGLPRHHRRRPKYPPHRHQRSRPDRTPHKSST